MKKYIAIGVTCVLAIMVLIYPYGISWSKVQRQPLNDRLSEYKSVKAASENAEADYAIAKNSFDSDREFEAYYGDVDRIMTVLDKVTSVNILSISTVDFLNGMKEEQYDVGDQASAIKFVLTTGDIKNGINIIRRLELPIYDITVTEPNTIEVIFLTGGNVK